MEDLFGILIFVIFAAVSIGTKLMKRREERTPAPRWPGPVAGPGVPGFPRPAWPDGQQRQAPPTVMRQAPPQYQVGEGLPGGEGLGSGVEGAGTEGPGSPSAEAEARRFTEETDRLGTLAQTANVPEDGARAEGTPIDLKGALTDRSAVAQAVIMAEVLGKPKALRRR